MNENRSNNVGQYILVQRTPNVAPRASSAPPANQNTNVVSICYTFNSNSEQSNLSTYREEFRHRITTTH